MSPVVEVQQSQPRDQKGRFSDKTTPPLVNVTVSNPVTYLNRWWQKIIGNEGVDLRLRIHPLTALVGCVALAFTGFGIGRISIPKPIANYIPQFAPTPNPWKETAFSGFLRYSETNKKFYLETQASEAITLEVPVNINLNKYVGRRIFATGRLNTETDILHISEAQDLELLPTTIVPIPTLIPSPSPIPTSL